MPNAKETSFLTPQEELKDCHDSYYSAVGELRAQLLEKAIRRLLVINPVFRSKPVGAPGSVARADQDEAIAAEDDLWRLIGRIATNANK